jgi:WD40 repeat protein
MSQPRARRLLTTLAAVVLAACVPLTPPIPPTAKAPEIADFSTLKPGTPRTTVAATLGAANRVLVTETVEVYSLTGVESYQAFLLMAPVFPGLAFDIVVEGEQVFHVLARYDASGRLTGLDWERGEAVHGRSAGQPGRILPRDSSDPHSLAKAPVARQASWQGKRVLVSDDGRRGLVLTLSGTDDVLMWRRLASAQLRDLDSGTPLGPVVEPPRSRLPLAALLADGRVAGVCDDFTLCLWDGATGQIESSVALARRGGFFPGRNAALAIAPEPGATQLAVTDRFDALALFSVPSLSAIPLRTLGGLAIPAWAGDTLVVAERVGMDRVRFTGGTSGRVLLETMHQMRGMSLTEPVDLPMGFGGAVKIYRWAAIHGEPAEGFFGLSQDGLRLALNRRSHVELYRRTDRSAAFALEAVMLLPPNYDDAHLMPVGTIGFSADGSRLAAGFGTLLVWDLATGREILRLLPGRAADDAGGTIDLAHGLHLLPDGRRFVTADGLFEIVEPATIAPVQEPDTS